MQVGVIVRLHDQVLGGVPQGASRQGVLVGAVPQQLDHGRVAGGCRRRQRGEKGGCGSGVRDRHADHDEGEAFGVCSWAGWVGAERGDAEVIVFGGLAGHLDQSRYWAWRSNGGRVRGS